MKSEKTLIDMALKMCTSDADLARRLGVTRATVCDLKAGRMKLSPELAAELADVVGVDPYQAAAAAMIANAKTPEKAERLRRVFLSRGGHGAVGMLLLCVSLALLTPSDASASGSQGSDLIAHSGKSRWASGLLTLVRRIGRGGQAHLRPLRFLVHALHVLHMASHAGARRILCCGWTRKVEMSPICA